MASYAANWTPDFALLEIPVDRDTSPPKLSASNHEESSKYSDAVVNSLIAAIPTSLLALIGFGVVHHLSIRRQRRDEFFKLVQSCLDDIDKISASSTEFWSASVSTENSIAHSERYVRQVARLSGRVEVMRLRQPRFIVGQQIIAYRKAITRDAELARPGPDLARVAELRDAGESLQQGIERAYFSIFG